MNINSAPPASNTGAARVSLLDLRAFRATLQKAVVWLVFPTLIVGAVVLATTWQRKQLYEASARVELGQTFDGSATGKSGRSELQLIRALARRVMAELPLGDQPEFQRSRLFDMSHFAERIGVQTLYGARKGDAQLVDTLSDRLSLRPSDDGRTLLVSFTSENPLIAERVAERVAQAYVELRREAKQEQLHDTAIALGTEIETMRARIVAAKGSASPEELAVLQQLESSVEALERKRGEISRGRDARLSAPARAAPLDKRAQQMETAVYAASATGMAGMLAVLVAAFASVRRRPRRLHVTAMPRALGEAPAYQALCEMGAKVMRSEDCRSGRHIEAGDERLVETLAAELAERPAGAKSLCILVATSAAKESSSVSVELARALANLGCRTVVVETQQKAVCLGQGGLGLAELLTQSASFADVIHRDPRSRVHFIGCGEAVMPAAKAVGERLPVAIDALALTYDFVIVAGPSVDEVAPFASVADAAVLVTSDTPASARSIAAYDQLGTLGLDDVIVLMVQPEQARKSARIAA